MGCARSPAPWASFVEAACVAEAKELMVAMARKIVLEVERGDHDGARASTRLRIMTFFYIDAVVIWGFL